MAGIAGGRSLGMRPGRGAEVGGRRKRRDASDSDTHSQSDVQRERRRVTECPSYTQV